MPWLSLILTLTLALSYLGNKLPGKKTAGHIDTVIKLFVYKFIFSSTKTICLIFSKELSIYYRRYDHIWAPFNPLSARTFFWSLKIWLCNAISQEWSNRITKFCFWKCQKPFIIFTVSGVAAVRSDHSVTPHWRLKGLKNVVFSCSHSMYS